MKNSWFERKDPEYIPFDRSREEIIERVTKLVAMAKRRASTYEKRVKYHKEDASILEASGYYLYTRALSYYRQRREYREGGDFSRFGLGTTKSQYASFTDKDIKNMEMALLKYLNVQTSTYSAYKEVHKKSNETILKRYGWVAEAHSKKENEIAFKLLKKLTEQTDYDSKRILIAISEKVQGSSTRSYSVNKNLQRLVNKELKKYSNIKWSKFKKEDLDSLIERYKKDDDYR